jgi:hypothetical protein
MRIPKNEGLFFSNNFSKAIQVKLSDKAFKAIMLEIERSDLENENFGIFEMQNPLLLIPLNYVRKLTILSKTLITSRMRWSLVMN